MGPYAFKGSQWVGFDDKEMIRRKSEYIREMGLGGGMVWALDLDDFNNRCGEGKHPLLRTIKEVLGPSKDEECSEGVKNETINETKENMEVDNQTEASDSIDIEPKAKSSYKIVCYFTNWAFYRSSEGKRYILPELYFQKIFISF